MIVGRSGSTRWFDLVLGEDKDEGKPGRKVMDGEEPVQLEVRNVSESEVHAMRKRHLGESMEMRFRKGEQRLSVDRDADLAFDVECTSRAWVGARRFEWVVDDDQAATAWTKLLGQPVTPGVPFSVDGSSRAEVREQVLRESPDLRLFVFGCLQKMRELGGAQVAESGKGSLTGLSID